MNGWCKMPNELIERNPVAAPASDRTEINKLANYLEDMSAGRSKNGHNCKTKLVGPDEQAIEIPDSVLTLMRQLVSYLSEGKGISIIPVNKELTTQEAAELLNVSRPFLIKLLDQGDLKFRYVGTHRRIAINDLIEYRNRRDTYRSQAIDEMIRISEEEGLYDIDVEFPE